MQVIKIKASIPWVAVESTEGPWVAVCDSLGLTVQSDTWGELMEDIATALDLMLADLLEDGLLDQFLEQHGWTRQNVTPKAPGEPSGDYRFDIPFIPELASNAEAQMLRV